MYSDGRCQAVANRPEADLPKLFLQFHGLARLRLLRGLSKNLGVVVLQVLSVTVGQAFFYSHLRVDT